MFYAKLFSNEYMVKPSRRLGELPTNREAYTAFILLAWPAMLESLFVCMASFIDNMMVAGASKTAIAAVGLTTQPRMLFYIPFFAIVGAVTAIVSRRYGEKNLEGANRCLAQATSIAALIALLTLIVAFTIAEKLLLFAGAQPDTLPEALVYFKITIVGLMFTAFSNIINAAQRGTGRTRITMRSSVTGNLLNIVLNYYLIGGVWIFPRLGVKGAAIATLIGNFTQFVISFCSLLLKSSDLHFCPRFLFAYEKTTLHAMLRVGSGAGAEQLLMRVGMFLFAKVVAELGTEAMTTHQICMNIINLSFACGDGLAAASAAMVGQNLGRKRPDLSLMYGKIAQRIAWIFSGMLFLLFSLGGRWLMQLFSQDETIIQTGVRVLIVVAFVSLTQSSQVVFTGSLRGAGDTAYNAVVSFFSIDIMRPLVAYFLCHVLGIGVLGAWFALMLDQYVRFTCMTVHFYKGKWMKIKL
ncbi:MAG: MATE family efflux transporter [Clostridia bacterium]|nr:MATE family efflux transporter [Clostridia bacterium]